MAMITRVRLSWEASTAGHEPVKRPVDKRKYLNMVQVSSKPASPYSIRKTKNGLSDYYIWDVEGWEDKRVAGPFPDKASAKVKAIEMYPDSVPVIRPCMCCQTPIEAYGKFHRLCNRCRAHGSSL